MRFHFSGGVVTTTFLFTFRFACGSCAVLTGLLSLSWIHGHDEDTHVVRPMGSVVLPYLRVCEDPHRFTMRFSGG